MRFISDFFSGMRAGLHLPNGTGPAYPRARRNKVRGANPSAASAGGKPAHPVVDVLVRGGILAICVALGSWALFAASGATPNPKSPIKSPVKWNAPVVFTDEVLATDPNAAPREWKYIVLHHSASVRGSAEIFDVAHRQRGWKCLGYHFVIGNGTDQGDGAIVAGPRWYSQEAGAHANATEFNEHGIGICLVGNFDQDVPTPAQLVALKTLINKLCHRYNIPGTNVVGHNQVRLGGSTACPGKNFPLKELREGL